ncbi:class I SAM-dependent methyltransferase [Azospirillum sp. A1-3]|uniref:class I SAM-dependent methyltransferase n=1 Tax=Azospirillum sp. A1-3 TaxID=185874 RepID=UPI00207785EC|nr:class I SAM-dependent methyltransferase [Azospirillum sp. A1-3]MCM8738756.1 class I SAM-dependent methyltransferase [Azospirillum sp. A1-3]
MLLNTQPKRVVEFGSGYSSCLFLDINEVFFKNKVQCTFVEPHPELLFSLINHDDQQRCQIMPCRAQDIPMSLIDNLDAGDVVFIDSTHVSKAGSDVNFHMFTTLPRLKSGVYIHFHDIFYPFEYPESWFFDENRSWNEIYMLRAFLTGNSDFEIVFFNDFMHVRHGAETEAALPMFILNPGGSLWLRKL